MRSPTLRGPTTARALMVASELLLRDLFGKVNALTQEIYVLDDTKRCKVRWYRASTKTGETWTV